MPAREGNSCAHLGSDSRCELSVPLLIFTRCEVAHAKRYLTRSELLQLPAAGPPASGPRARKVSAPYLRVCRTPPSTRPPRAASRPSTPGARCRRFCSFRQFCCARTPRPTPPPAHSSPSHFASVVLLDHTGCSSALTSCPCLHLDPSGGRAGWAAGDDVQAQDGAGR